MFKMIAKIFSVPLVCGVFIVAFEEAKETLITIFKKDRGE